MTNAEIIKIFHEMAQYLEMEEVPFKPRAYERVASALEALEEEVAGIYRHSGLDGLHKIPGVGEALALHIAEMLKTGRFKEYEQLKKKLPIKLDELTAVEGMGPKKAKVLYEKLGVKNLKDLERAAKEGKIAKLEHFGKKTEENILQGIGFLKSGGGRMLLGEALPRARKMIAELKKIPGVVAVSEAGSLRRRQETIGDIDILVASAKAKEVFAHVVRIPGVVKIWGQGPTKASVHLKEGFDVDVRVIDPASWGAALQYFTGSKAHNIKTRTIAVKKRLKLNEYGVYKGTRSVAGRTEEEVYKALGLPYFEPEMREDTGEVEYALKHKTMPALIGYDDMRGDLHVHSTWTDGANSIEEMAEEAKRMGYEYIVMTDHTKNLAMTHGSDEARLRRQMKEIDKINGRMRGITILKGAEVDILKDGTLDIDDDTLKELDVVGISVHSYFKMPQKEMTERILRAMNNPHADILFHPTGRLIGKRPAYQADMERMIREAKNTGTVLEINASPERLDLKDEYIRMAREQGVKFSIDTDAHSTAHLHFMEYGIAQARRGWVEREDVVNAWPFKKMLALLKDRNKR